MSAPTPLPLALRVVALLFLCQGIYAVITIVVCALHNRIQLDFDVLDLCVYFGLLRLSSGWRTFALVLTGLALLFFPVIAVLSVALPQTHANVNLFGLPGAEIPHGVVTLFSILWFGVALWQWSILTRPDIVSLFIRPKLADA